MKKLGTTAALILWVIVGGNQTAQSGSSYNGEFKLGYIHKSDEGNRSVQQPTFNLYEGVAASLENFRWNFDNGTRITAQLRNLTLNDRNLSAQMNRTGWYGFNFAHNQYRRVYSFDGSSFTKRKQISSNLWVQPLTGVRLFGGYRVIARKGSGQELYEPSELPNLVVEDYNQKHYHAGVRFTRSRSSLQAEYRESNSNDEVGSEAARDSKRYKLAASSIVPFYQKLSLYGGYQHFEWMLSDTNKGLSSNTVWSGGRLEVVKNLFLKYGFVFDRAKGNEDLVATDNISQAVVVEKVWPSRAGLALGYTYKTNDNLTIVKATDGYTVSGWLKPVSHVSVSADYGAVREDLREGSTLTGAADATRYQAAIKYMESTRQMTFKFESRKTTNDDIGSTVDFVRVGSDVAIGKASLGDILLSYSYQHGDYENNSTAFAFADHTMYAEATSVFFRSLQLITRGIYYRSRRDLNIESISFGLTGRYKLTSDLMFEAAYSSYVFDDLYLTTAEYSRYYTAHIVEVKIVKSF